MTGVQTCALRSPPNALGVIRVAVLQIDLGDLQVDRRLFAGFVEGVEESPGFFGVRGLKAVPFLRQGVEGVVDSLLATEAVVALFHGSFFCYRASHNFVPTC